MIYKGSTRLKLYKGNHHPAQLYKGSTKIAGWKMSEQTGVTLKFSDTYNDDVQSLVIHGQSVQDGEPSPDNPYELKSVGDDGGFDLVSAGKNLFPYTLDYVYSNTNAKIEGNKITLSAKDTSHDYSFARYEGFRFSAGQTVYIKFKAQKTVAEGHSYVYLRYYNSETSSYVNLQQIFLSQSTDEISYSRAYVIPKTATYQLIFYQNNGVGGKPNTDVIYSDIMVSLTDVPYTPFRGMQTVHIPYTLRSLPDGTCDYIEIDNVAKKAIYQPLTNAYTFNGTENWIKDAAMFDTTDTLGFYVNVPGILRTTDSSKTYIRCDKFNVIPYVNWLSANVMCCSSLHRSLNVKALKSELPTQDLAGFKAWLGDNPITIIYRLEDPPAPIELDYTTVRTYYPYTNIYTISTVQPTLEGKIRVWTA